MVLRQIFTVCILSEIQFKGNSFNKRDYMYKQTDVMKSYST